MNDMWLLIDAGNTNLSCALFDGKRIRATRDIPHEDLTLLSAFVCDHGVSDVLLSSVVPAATKRIAGFSRKHGWRLRVCGRDLTIPVANRYRRPSEVGQDRLLNVFAVSRVYPDDGIRLVVDIGTAVTFDFIGEDGAYEGGLIYPGMRSSLKALLDDCALLPDALDLKKAKTIYAKSTEEGINNGIIFGYSFMIRGMIEHLRSLASKGTFHTLITGGAGALLKKDIAGYDRYDNDLALKGLACLVREIS
jgi:type III pantothenate kinase